MRKQKAKAKLETVNFDNAYRAYARRVHKRAGKLTKQERERAVVEHIKRMLGQV